MPIHLQAVQGFYFLQLNMNGKLTSKKLIIE